jgi:hypothetical protein
MAPSTSSTQLNADSAPDVDTSSFKDNLRVPAKRADGRRAAVQAVATDGSLTVASWQPPKVGGAVPELVGDVRIESWSPGHKRVVSDGPKTRVGGPSQIVGAAQCSAQPVWVETHSVDLDHQDWRVWTVPTGGGGPRLLGSSSALTPGRVPLSPALYVSNPVAGGGVAYWPVTVPAASKGAATGSWQTAIAGRQLDGSGRLRVVARDAIFPQALPDGRLLYVRPHGLGHSTVPAGTVEIRQVEQGVDTLVASTRVKAGSKLVGFAADTDLLAVKVADTPGRDATSSGQLRVWSAPGLTSRRLPWQLPEPLTIQLAGDGVGVEASSGFLAWGNGSGNGDGGEYVLDVGRRALSRLAVNEGASEVHICHRRVAWSIPAPDGSGASSWVAGTLR